MSSQTRSMSAITCEAITTVGGRLRDAVHQQLQELAAGERIEPRERLVEQQQPRPLAEHERQRELRSVAGRQSARPSRAGRVASSRPATISASQRGFVRRANSAACADGERAVERRPLRQEADLGEHRRLASGSRPSTVDASPRSGRAGPPRARAASTCPAAFGPDEPDDLAFGNRERAVAQPPVTMEALAEVPRARARASCHRGSPRLAQGRGDERADALVVEARLDRPTPARPRTRHEARRDGAARAARACSRRTSRAPGARRRARRSRAVAIGLRDRVRVDREIGDHLAHRRQLVTDVDRPEPERLLHLLDDLEVGCDAGAGSRWNWITRASYRRRGEDPQVIAARSQARSGAAPERLEATRRPDGRGGLVAGGRETGHAGGAAMSQVMFESRARASRSAWVPWRPPPCARRAR